MPENKPEQSQIDKFRDLARELEVDENEEAFKEKVRKVATATQPPPQRSKLP
jgi:hypothetical protein